ncbi:MAG: beta-ketoacyl synthase N-terminal-like domain-containing protein [Candidatus Peregrinibacteria bacterium]|nr:beta-ketoacyl synthase N-terminal-like domain-containing protein [Candidatus Peregrinibacteria bacterium]
MQRAISLIGSGQTRFGEWWDKSLRDLMAEALDSALSASPATALDIDAVIVANMLGEFTNAQAHLGTLASALLPHRPPALRVEAACGSGSLAVHMACALLESNRAQSVLVLGVEKMTDASQEDIASALMAAADAELDRPSGITFPGIFGLIARRYMHEYGLTRDELSLVSAVHHMHGKENPYAQFRSAIPPETISKSPLIADPLRLLDCSPISDGAAALILSTKYQTPMRLLASQVASDTVSITERPSLTSFPATKEACEKALREAEISLDDVGAVETHDCFSIAALINLEDMGFANPGEAIRIYKDIHEGKSTMRLNRSGGLKACGHPVAATGIKQIIDVAKQLQAHEERYGIAHNFGGAGATCGVHVLASMP